VAYRGKKNKWLDGEYFLLVPSKMLKNSFSGIKGVPLYFVPANIDGCLVTVNWTTVHLNQAKIKDFSKKS
jgi:hypothetical protein